MPRVPRAVATLVVLTGLLGGPVRAAESRSPFEVDLKVDLPIIVAAGLLSLGPLMLEKELSGPHCTGGCDRDSLNFLDRTVVGYRSEAAYTAANVLVYSAVALPFALDALDVALSDTSDGWWGYGRDALVFTETLLVNNALFQLTKSAVRRPRLYVYDAAEPVEEREQADAARSFYSGHTANAFGMATAYSYLFMNRHPDSDLVIPVWVGTHLIAAGVGVGQVLAGEHFWSDVIVGAAVGSAVGLLVPALHLREDDPQSGAAGLSLHVAPGVTPGGFGITLSVL